MHNRNRLAKAVSMQRWQIRRRMLAKGPTFSLFKASSIAVVGAVLLSTVCGLLGDQLVHLFTTNSHQVVAFCEVVIAPFLSGLALGMIIQRSKGLPKPSLRQAGFALWSWLLAAELAYCLVNGMPPLLAVLVLFIYGFFLQLLVFGLALLGIYLARYVRPQITD